MDYCRQLAYERSHDETCDKVAIMSPVARAVNGLGLVYKWHSPSLNLVRFPRNISFASACELSALIPCRPLPLSLDSDPCLPTTSPLNLAVAKEYQYFTSALNFQSTPNGGTSAKGGHRVLRR